jgi:hypothetical protein
MNDPRRDRKILVAVGFSGSQVARAGHQELATHWNWRHAPMFGGREEIACPI